MNIAELCKGSTADSDSVREGSNPSSAAKNLTSFDLSGFQLNKIRWIYFISYCVAIFHYTIIEDEVRIFSVCVLRLYML